MYKDRVKHLRWIFFTKEVTAKSRELFPQKKLHHRCLRFKYSFEMYCQCWKLDRNRLKQVFKRGNRSDVRLAQCLTEFLIGDGFEMTNPSV